MLDLVALGKRLQEERRRLGLTQEEVANRVDVSRASIAGYERGRTPPDVEFIERLREIGVRTEYVVNGKTVSSDPVAPFDWQLARDLVRCIVEYADGQGIELEHSKLIDLMQVLYATAVRNKEIDKGAVEAAVRLAA